MDVCPPRIFLMFLFRLASFILLGIVRVVQLEECDNTTFSVHRVSGNNQGDIFTHPSMPCVIDQSSSCSGCEDYGATQMNNGDANQQCKCQCTNYKQTFLFDRCRQDFSSPYVASMTDCEQKFFLHSTSHEMQMINFPDKQAGHLTPLKPLLNNERDPIDLNCNIASTGEYFYQYNEINDADEDNQNWMPLSTLQHSDTSFFSIGKRPNNRNFIKLNGSPTQDLRSCFSGLIIGLIIDCGDELRGCVSFKLEGTLSYNHSTGIAPCPQGGTTISSGSTPNADITTTRPRVTVAVTTATLVSKDSTEQQTGIATNRQTQGTTKFTSTPSYTKSPADITTTRPRVPITTTVAVTTATLVSKDSTEQQTDIATSRQTQGTTKFTSTSYRPGMMERQGSSTPAIVGGVCGAAVIFIIAGVAVFILWRRKFRHNTEKGNNRGVTMSSLQNGHSQPTEGTVDNVIYAGDNAGIVDNLIYEGGMGADGVFSNPGYADKTPQFKPRMDVPGAFVQPNPGATNKTPQPQRNVIIDEPQYAQIVDDQYADPQKVRDKKNKKKAAKDKNNADLHGPQPGANNSNSNHVYQGLNKGADYQSLRGPREHHEVRPSQVLKTPQDGHDYASLTPGSSGPSAGTLSKEGPDYTVLEGPDSPGEETAAGPDYTTLDGPDSPGDEITSGPDYTVLDGPDSPGD